MNVLRYSFDSNFKHLIRYETQSGFSRGGGERKSWRSLSPHKPAPVGDVVKGEAPMPDAAPLVEQPFMSSVRERAAAFDNASESFNVLVTTCSCTVVDFVSFMNLIDNTSCINFCRQINMLEMKNLFMLKGYFGEFHSASFRQYVDFKLPQLAVWKKAVKCG